MGFSWRSIHPESFHIELLSGCRLSRVFGKQHVPVKNEKKYCREFDIVKILEVFRFFDELFGNSIGIQRKF